jgi:integrase
VDVPEAVAAGRYRSTIVVVSSTHVHDLRHSFAVSSLLDAYTRDLDIDRRLTLLATYLGHRSPAGTYWYLSAAPELLAAALERLDRTGDGRS